MLGFTTRQALVALALPALPCPGRPALIVGD